MPIKLVDGARKLHILDDEIAFRAYVSSKRLKMSNMLELIGIGLTGKREASEEQQNTTTGDVCISASALALASLLAMATVSRTALANAPRPRTASLRLMSMQKRLGLTDAAYYAIRNAQYAIHFTENWTSHNTQ